MSRRKRNPLQPTTNPIDPRCIVPGGRHRAPQGSKRRPLPQRPKELPHNPIPALKHIATCENTTERIRAWARAVLSSTDEMANPAAAGVDVNRYTCGVPVALARCGLPGWRPSQLLKALAMVRRCAAGSEPSMPKAPKRKRRPRKHR